MTISLKSINLSISSLHKYYQQGDFTPADLIQALREECEKEHNAKGESRNPIWIHLLTEQELAPYVNGLEKGSLDIFPLYGIPFAIKDNIDLAGIPTTAGCKEYAYTPEKSAFVVQQLIMAGAIPIGKTNMDQFATGLVGVRSPEPWGPCKNSLNPEYISGGSSSGSSVATAKQLVSFALGTDTAGSGRVPASLNNIVGLKPSRGLLSTSGVVPACRSLDCVSIFTASAEDANTVLDVAAQFDSNDAFARKNTYANSKRYFQPMNEAFVIGVPAHDQLEFFDNEETAQLFQYAIQQLKDSGAKIKEIDFQPFVTAAKLLYEGPWVAERYWAVGDFIQNNPNAILPVIKNIIASGNQASAVDAFDAKYKLQALQQLVNEQLNGVDAVVTPTIGTIYTIDEVEQDPIQLNSNLGYYTNFMNLLDCAAVTVPSGFYQNKVGFGITLFHQACSDKLLLSIAEKLQQLTKLPIGAAENQLPTGQALTRLPKDMIDVVVCGAHLDGLPLNWQLRERDASLVEKTLSSPNYKLYALAGGPPFRPGMMRVEQEGTAIEVEVWRMPTENFGSFVSEIPQPLGIGKVELFDGRWESGFICESIGLDGAKDITAFGAWREYMKSLQ